MITNGTRHDVFRVKSVVLSVSEPINSCDSESLKIEESILRVSFTIISFTLDILLTYHKHRIFILAHFTVSCCYCFVVDVILTFFISLSIFIEGIK